MASVWVGHWFILYGQVKSLLLYCVKLCVVLAGHLSEFYRRCQYIALYCRIWSDFFLWCVPRKYFLCNASWKLLDDLKDRRGYSHLKEEALDRTMWRHRFGGGFGLVVRQNTKWMNECKLEDTFINYWWMLTAHDCYFAVYIAIIFNLLLNTLFSVITTLSRVTLSSSFLLMLTSPSI